MKGLPVGSITTYDAATHGPTEFNSTYSPTTVSSRVGEAASNGPRCLDANLNKVKNEATTTSIYIFKCGTDVDGANYI